MWQPLICLVMIMSSFAYIKAEASHDLIDKEDATKLKADKDEVADYLMGQVIRSLLKGDKMVTSDGKNELKDEGTKSVCKVTTGIGDVTKNKALRFVFAAKSTKECVAKCTEKRKTDSRINGLSFGGKYAKYCYCNYHMGNIYSSFKHYESCIWTHPLPAAGECRPNLGVREYKKKVYVYPKEKSQRGCRKECYEKKKKSSVINAAEYYKSGSCICMELATSVIESSRTNVCTLAPLPEGYIYPLTTTKYHCKLGKGKGYDKYSRSVTGIEVGRMSLQSCYDECVWRNKEDNSINGLSFGEGNSEDKSVNGLSFGEGKCKCVRNITSSGGRNQDQDQYISCVFIGPLPAKGSCQNNAAAYESKDSVRMSGIKGKADCINKCTETKKKSGEVQLAVYSSYGCSCESGATGVFYSPGISACTVDDTYSQLKTTKYRCKLGKGKMVGDYYKRLPVIEMGRISLQTCYDRCVEKNSKDRSVNGLNYGEGNCECFKKFETEERNEEYQYVSCVFVGPLPAKGSCDNTADVYESKDSVRLSGIKGKADCVNRCIETRKKSGEVQLAFYSGWLCNCVSGATGVIYSSGTSVCNVGKVDGEWGDWTEYSECSTTCGGGIQKKTRPCDKPKPANGGKECSGEKEETKSCNNDQCAVNGDWGKWTEYSECSKTCAGGTQKKTRECDKPKPAHGGNKCSGEKEETKSCNNDKCSTGTTVQQVSCGPFKASSCSVCPHKYRFNRCEGDCKWCNGGCQLRTKVCPVNGGWGAWQSVSQCRCVRGRWWGIQRRIRSCDHPRPANGGEYCRGAHSQSRDCHGRCYYG